MSASPTKPCEGIRLLRRALKETVLNLQRVVEDAERALKRAEERSPAKSGWRMVNGGFRPPSLLYLDGRRKGSVNWQVMKMCNLRSF